jgi:DNA mismatch endonuclease (patch repair protein)
MLANKSRNTRPELALRSALFARGMRFRVHYPVPANKRRTIDVAFTRRRLAVFVDGCFFHGCEDRTIPVTNSDFWRSKIAKNRARDLETVALLEQDGWRCLRFWEHQPVDECVAAIEAVLDRAPMSRT